MPPRQKRKRTLSNNADPPFDPASGSDSFTKSTDIYLEDGNIAVVAGNVAFRVHRSQLALHSEVFRDMLSLVTQPKDGEIYDGCPVVRLTDVSKDLAVLFKVMYGQIYLEPEMVNQLISVLRLATKYLMDHIRTSAVKVLAISYPQTLELWDSYKGSRRRCGDIIRIATAVNADILLPAAYYAISMESAPEIFKIDLPPTALQNCFSGRDDLLTKLSWFLWVKLEGRSECDDCTGKDCSRFLHALMPSRCTRFRSEAIARRFTRPTRGTHSFERIGSFYLSLPTMQERTSRGYCQV